MSALRALRDGATHSATTTLWRSGSNSGWPAAVLPEAYGGLEIGLKGSGSGVQIGARWQPRRCCLWCAVLGREAGLQRAPATTATATLAAATGGGRRLLALALDESRATIPSRNGHHGGADGNELAAARTAAKAFVLDGHVAERLIVVARCGGAPGDTAGLALFLVDPARRRASRSSASWMVDGRNAAMLRLHDAHRR